MTSEKPSPYDFFGRGGCLGGLVPDGSMLNADPNAEINPGDLVTIVMRPSSAQDPYFGYGLHFGIAGVVKVYLGRSAHPCGETVHLFGLLSPAGTLSMPESRIDAMHKVASVTRMEGDDTPEARAATDLSLSLIMPFLQAAEPLQPINPGWRPAGEGAFFSMGTILESATGPTIGAAADAIEIALKARDAAAGKITGNEAKAPYADALNLLLGNNPVFYANLFYVRPALDYLFLNSMREAVSPGYLKRRGKRRMKDYQQQNIVERNSLRPFG